MKTVNTIKATVILKVKFANPVELFDNACRMTKALVEFGGVYTARGANLDDLRRIAVGKFQELAPGVEILEAWYRLPNGDVRESHSKNLNRV